MLRTRGIVSANEYRQLNFRIAYGVCFAAGILLSLIMLYPIFWVFSSALKSPADIYKVPPVFFPRIMFWRNFLTAWKVFEFPRMFLNSVLVFMGVLAARLFVVTLAAYSLSRLVLPFRKVFYMMFLATLMLPAMAYLVPSFLVVQNLGLNDTWWAVWLPAAASSMPLLLAKGFFDEIPRELSEAARIDGASELGTLRYVILPNSKPIIAVIGIFAFLEVWNNFFWQRIVLSSTSKWTMAVMLWWKTNTIGGAPAMNVQLAGMFFSLIPPFIVFLLFQKYITEGITFSGLKG